MEIDNLLPSAREDSTPPEASEASTPALVFSNTPPPLNRKRKHAAIDSTTGSPAPSDQGLVGAQAAGASVLTGKSTGDEDNRPRLTVSKEPVFIPVGDNSSYFTTDQIAVNRLGFRYIPCGLPPDVKDPMYRMIKSYPPGYVRVSWEDRSPFVKVTQDGLGLCGEKGYRSARLNVPVREGKWYLEVKVEHGGGAKLPESPAKEGAHVRLGWGRREAMLNCPVGLDGYSYGYLDKDGRKVTLSRPRPYGKAFGSGDTIGLYISLPPKRKPKANDPYDPAHLRRERIAIEFKGQTYFESVEYPQSKEMLALMDAANNKPKDTASLPSSSKKAATAKSVPDRGKGGTKSRPESAPLQPLPVLRGSLVSFFVNGEPQGVAFHDIYDYLQLRSVPSPRNKGNRRRVLKEGYVEHTENPFDDGWLGYYPFISLFNGARVRINAGPDFDFPPPNNVDGVLAGDPDAADTKERDWRPLCERYDEFIQEQKELDIRDEEEFISKNGQQKEVQQEKPKPAPSKSKRAPADSHSRKGQKGSKAASSATFAASAKPEETPEPHKAPSTSGQSQDGVEKDKADPEPEENSSAQNGTHTLSEDEKKIQARRERKRELERARRARQREEKLRQKQLASEESLKNAEATAHAAARAAAEARMAAAGFRVTQRTSASYSKSPSSSAEPPSEEKGAMMDAMDTDS